MANSVDPDQTAPISGFTLFASILNSSVMLGNYLQQTTSADDIFRCICFLALYGLNQKGHIKVALKNKDHTQKPSQTMGATVINNNRTIALQWTAARTRSSGDPY